MSKIICEICETVIPEGATECPLCGFPVTGGELPEAPVLGQLDQLDRLLSDDADLTAQLQAVGLLDESELLGQPDLLEEVVMQETPAEAELPETPAEPVKAEKIPAPKAKKPQAEEKKPKEMKPAAVVHTETPEEGRKMKIVIIALLIGVILVGAYIGFRFLMGADAYEEAANREPAGQTSEDQSQDDEPDFVGVPCTNLVLSDSSVTLSGVGRGWIMGVTAVPADTTDVIVFTSSDESIATVTAEGRITAVAPGTCTITITCGQITKECKIYCDFEVEEVDSDKDTDETDKTDEDNTDETTDETTEETTQATTTATTTEKEGFNLSHTDVTFSFKGDHFTFSAGKGISNAQVTWSIDKPEVAVVSSSGKVVAVGPGKAVITATYEGETLECVIRCTFEADGSEETTDETEGTTSSDTSWKISHEDVTISVGESFQLTLKNDSGETATVTWTAGNGDLLTANGNTITGKARGNTTVSCNYNGKTYSCIVRVK